MSRRKSAGVARLSAYAGRISVLDALLVEFSLVEKRAAAPKPEAST